MISKTCTPPRRRTCKKNDWNNRELLQNDWHIRKINTFVKLKRCINLFGLKVKTIPHLPQVFYPFWSLFASFISFIVLRNVYLWLVYKICVLGALRWNKANWLSMHLHATHLCFMFIRVNRPFASKASFHICNYTTFSMRKWKQLAISYRYFRCISGSSTRKFESIEK